MNFLKKIFAPVKDAAPETRCPETNRKVEKTELIVVYNEYLKRYIAMGVVSEKEVIETVCDICKGNTPLKDEESVKSKIDEKLNLVIL